jgi:hypothetical protein
MIMPAAASADGIFAQTEQPVLTGAGTAAFSGDVDAGDAATTYSFQYDLASSQWCSSDGTAGSPADTTATGTTSAAGPVTIAVTGLTAGSAYCVEIDATNPSGSSAGSQLTFTAGAPAARTDGVAPTGAATATLSGAVDPAGQSTTYSVQYAPDSSDWCASAGADGAPAATTTAQALAATGTENVAVTVDLAGLTGGDHYCAELAAVNGSGSARSDQYTFKAGQPAVQTPSESTTGAATATVDGEIDPAGQTTTYQLQYDVDSSAWCESWGTSGSPANVTPSQTLGFTDSQSHDAPVSIAGLTPGTEYCAELTASNGSGSATSDTIEFTAGAPVVSTGEVTVTAAGSATVAGQIDPAGQTTTYVVQYGPQSSQWCSSDGAGGSPANTTASQTLDFTDSQNHDVAVQLTGLSSASAYCAELVATSSGLSEPGDQVNFTAGSADATPPVITPTAPTTATVDGQIDAAGQTTTIRVDYDLADSNWCETGDGSASWSTPEQSFAYTDGAAHAAEVGLAGLNAGTAYCAELVATDAAGSVWSAPATFTAGAPTATAAAVGAPAATSATISGQIDPASAATTYAVAYDLASSDWCEFGTGTAGETTAAQPLPATDGAEHAVSVTVTGLAPGTAYCAALVATNGDGVSTGGRLPLTTPALSAPVVSTGTAGAITTTTVTLAGSLTPGGQATSYRFDYGATTAYGSSTAVTAAGSGSSESTVSAALSGLSPGTSYHFRLEATNATGTTDGADQTFTTSTPPPPPVVTTGSVSAITPTSATVAATVSASGQATTYQFDYGTTTAYGSSTAAVPAGSSSASQPVSTALSGLTPATTYHVRVEATNASGTSDGADETFTTSAAPAPPPAPSPPPSSYTVTAGTAGAGTGHVISLPFGLDCLKSCSYAFTRASTVWLIAIPAAGSTFGGWHGACSGFTRCTLLIGAPFTVTATFNKAAPRCAAVDRTSPAPVTRARRAGRRRENATRRRTPAKRAGTRIARATSCTTVSG